jgi:hypothetical protein
VPEARPRGYPAKAKRRPLQEREKILIADDDGRLHANQRLQKLARIGFSRSGGVGVVIHPSDIASIKHNELNSSLFFS